MTIEPLRVRDFMTADPLTVRAEDPIMAAVKLLVEHDISGVIVVDDDAAPVGILTERDCIRTALQAGYFDESAGTVGHYMTRQLHAVRPDDNLVDVAELFADSPFRRCPVVTEGRLVGIIFRRDVLRALTESAWFGQPQ
jgi:CBS domain-containing protein